MSRRKLIRRRGFLLTEKPFFCIKRPSLTFPTFAANNFRDDTRVAAELSLVNDATPIRSTDRSVDPNRPLYPPVSLATTLRARTRSDPSLLISVRRGNDTVRSRPPSVRHFESRRS